MSTKDHFYRLYFYPSVIALVVCSGLYSALVSEGWGDVWSWCALAVPCLYSSYLLYPRKSSRNERRASRRESK